MAKIIVTFEEMGGIGEFNGMSVVLATRSIINKAADYMVRIAGPQFDETADCAGVHCDFTRRRVIFELEGVHTTAQDAELNMVLSKVLQDTELLDVFQRLGAQ